MDRSSTAVNEKMIRACFAAAAAKGAPSHAYLIEGEDSGVLMDLALHFAKLLLCEKHTACGECFSCRALDRGEHPDLKFIIPEKPNLIRVDDIRDGLIDDIGIRPYRSDYKIYIIEHAERMNVQAQNALLKTLEEPPSYGVILLLSCNSEAFLPTVISRSVRLSAMAGGHGFDRIPAEDRERLIRMLVSVKDADISRISAFAEELDKEGADPLHVISAVRTWIRDIMLLKLTGKKDGVVIKEALPVLTELAEGYTWSRINDILKNTDAVSDRIRSGVNTVWSYELLFERMR